MNYLHNDINVGINDIIQVELDKSANVRLMDSINYQNYRNGQQYKYYGGLAKKSPINLKAPYQGHWHLVIDLEGFTGTVRASIKIIKG